MNMKKIINTGLNAISIGSQIIGFGTLIYFLKEYLKNTDFVITPSEADVNTRTYLVGYSDAIAAIGVSDMFSSHKQQAIAEVKKNESEEYYKAIINIVKGNGFSSHKVDSITSISCSNN